MLNVAVSSTSSPVHADTGRESAGNGSPDMSSALITRTGIYSGAVALNRI